MLLPLLFVKYKSDIVSLRATLENLFCDIATEPELYRICHNTLGEKSILIKRKCRSNIDQIRHSDGMSFLVPEAPRQA